VKPWATSPQRNDYRNPVVAEAMRALGYVNRYGQGVLRAQRALSDNGNRPAEFTADARWFSVRIPARTAASAAGSATSAAP
jgi:ATP-dependent DNA helicase RecG